MIRAIYPFLLDSVKWAISLLGNQSAKKKFHFFACSYSVSSEFFLCPKSGFNCGQQVNKYSRMRENLFLAVVVSFMGILFSISRNATIRWKLLLFATDTVAAIKLNQPPCDCGHLANSLGSVKALSFHYHF